MSTRDRFFRWLAWLLPARLVMWCYYRVFSYATTRPRYVTTEPGSMKAFEVIECWSKDHRL